MRIETADYREQYPYRPVNTFSHLRLSEIGTLQEVLDCLDALRRNQPHYRFLCTLDDINQCCYTSMHASGDERLDLDNGVEVDFDNPQSLHEWETHRLGQLATQLQAPQWQVSWNDLAGTLAVGDEDIQALLLLNRNPGEVLDKVVYVQRLPLSSDDLMIAGLPNGYFTCDWDVFQNHAVILHLQEKHQARFFGIGASWLGFVRETPWQKDQAQRLIADLRQLYGQADQQDDQQDDQQVIWDELTEIVQRQKVLLLGYTETLSE